MARRRKAPQGLASPADLERIRLQAQAVMLDKQRKGEWTHGVQPHPYQKHPVEWIVEYLGVPEHTIRWSINGGLYEDHKWDGDKNPLVQILESLARWEDCGVESATGTGKTYLAACIVLWFLACHQDSLVVTAAPKADQLLLQVWMEIGKLWPRFQRHFPSAELLNGKIRMKPDEDGKETWAAIAFVCGVGADEEAAQKAQGFHREHMLIITEETPGIHPAIMTSFYHTRTDDHNLHLALGNPDSRNDPLHRFCFDVNEEPIPGVNHVRISAFDFPNIVCQRSVVPGAIGQKRLTQRIANFGEGTRLYGSRIRGISPAEAEDALIRWEWCVAAGERYNDPKYREGTLALGVDVADTPQGDPAAIARWQGACLTDVEAFAAQDASYVGERVVLEARDKNNPVDPRYIGIDSVGVGASAVNTMRRMGLKVRHISGGARAAPGLDVDTMWSETEPDLEGRIRATGPTIVEAERFNNLRSQVWWRMREDLRLNKVALPMDEGLWQDLCTPTYKTQGGKIVVQPKEEIIVLLKRSPNKGDAACYGNFVRRRQPLRTRIEAEPKSKNVDYGLERRLSRMERIQQAEEKRHQRMFARSARMRRKA